MKKLTAFLIVLALICGLTACGAPEKPVEEPPVPVEQSAPSQDYSDIFKAVKDCRQQRDLFFKSSAVFNGAVDDMTVESVEQSDAAADEVEPGFSGTNVQVKGVDEGDLVKTDGKTIYSLFGNTLNVFRADGENTVLLAAQDVSDENSWVTEMYLSGDRLYLIKHEYGIVVDSVWREGDYNGPRTSVLVYDVSDPSDPTYVNSSGQDGNFRTSRMYNGELYIVTNHWLYDEPKETDPKTFVPCTYNDGVCEPVPADSVCLLPEPESTCYTVVTKYAADGSILQNLSILGGCDELYMNAESMYLTRGRYEDKIVEEYTEDIYKVEHHRCEQTTEIRRIDLASMQLAATGSIPGHLESQFSMDEYNGSLRVAATVNRDEYKIYIDEKHDFQNYEKIDSGSSTGLYVLDAGMNVIGSVDGLAEDEYIRSVRFDGDFVYFCTFRQTDPLFAVELTDPTKPVILSEYKISGFSEYLHPWTDGLLFGFGQEADEESGRTEGLKLVMFDVSDRRDVRAAHTKALSERSSEALYNHKAILVSPEKNLIGFSADDSYKLWSYDPETGFTLLKSLSLNVDWYSARGLWIDDCAYIVHEGGIEVLSLDTLDELVGIVRNNSVVNG